MYARLSWPPVSYSVHVAKGGPGGGSREPRAIQGIVNKIIEKKLQFITLLTATCIVSHIENSKDDKGYIT